MILCPNCQSENREEAKFCDNCGTRLEVSCPSCGTLNRPGAKFCDNCGERLVTKPAPQSVDHPAPTAPRKEREAQGVRGEGVLNTLIPQELALKLETARAEQTMVGERRIVTILFCDVKGSTTAASQLDPEEWGEIINGAFERMIHPVYKYEGTVARLMGDGILAFFGAPIAHEDDPQRAVLAGLDIIEAIEPYREQVRGRWRVDFDVRLGINTGLVMVGQVGSDLQMEYTALGDAINLASRMEQTAQPGTVRVAEDTYKLVAPLFEWDDLGEKEVKGKDQAVHIYRPLRYKEQPGPLRGLESHGLSSPLVGREVELDFLRQRLEALRAGRGSFVVLMGEAGLGKSRLIAELHLQVESSPEDELNWLEGHTISYRQSSSYYLWRQVIRQAIGAKKSDSPAIVRQKLAYMCECCSLPGGDVPFLEALLAVESEATLQSIRGYEGEAMARRMTEATRGFICGISQEAPTVVVFDDLHWADQASLELLLDLSDITRLFPLLLFGLLRPDKEAASWNFRQHLQDKLGSDYAEIALRPLPAGTSRALLANLLAFDQLPEGLRTLILEKAEGNPFYVEEVVRDLIQRGLVLKQDDPSSGHVSWRAATNVDDIDIPENLQTLLIARIDRLEEEARRTLQLASVIGRSFYYRILEAVNKAVVAVRSGLEPHLLTLQRAELILEAARLPEPEYMFRHSLTQEAAYKTILIKQRREFHQRVGEAIESLFADRLEDFYPVLAHHFWEADDPRALKYEILAGDAAFRLYAIPEAIGHYSRALEIGEHAPESAASSSPDTKIPTSESLDRLTHLYLRLGRCYELQSNYSAALRNYEAMEDFASRSSEPHMGLSALIAQATAYAIPTPVQDAEKARSYAEKALSLSRRIGDQQAEAKVLWIYQLSFMYSGYMDRGIPYGEESAALARRLNLKGQLAHALQDLSVAYMAIGDLQKGRQVLEESMPLWEELGNLPMQAENRANSALERIMSGDFEASIALSDESYAISQRIKNEWGQVNSRVFISMVYWARGEIDRALENLKTATTLAKNVGHPGAALGLVQAAYVYESLGAGKRAFQAAEEASEVAKSNPPFYFYSLAVLARFNLRRGDLAKAEKLLKQSFEIGHSKTLLEMDIIIAIVNIERALAQGEIEKARSLMQSLLTLLNDSGVLYFLPEALALQARLLTSQGYLEEAQTALKEARTVAQEIGFHMASWRISSELAALETRLGNPAGAGRLWDEARQTVEAIAGHIKDPDLLASFRELVSGYHLGERSPG